MNFVIVCALIGLLPAAIAQSKGRSFVAWWLYGAALFIFALPHALMMGTRVGHGKQKCPFCAELIQAEAAVCRYCGRDLPLPVGAIEIERAPEAAPAIPAPAEAPTLSEAELQRIDDEIRAKGAMRFKVTAVAIGAIALWIAAYAALHPGKSTSQARTVYTSYASFLRETPSADGKITGELEANTALVSDSTANHWLRVRLSNGSLSGWIHDTDIWSPTQPRSLSEKPVSTPAPTSSGPYVYADIGATVRSRPSSKAPLVRRVAEGMKLEYTVERNGWFRLATTDTSASEWVSSKAVLTPSQHSERASADLRLETWNWSIEYGYATAEGQVTNVSGRTLENVQALVTFSTGSGEFISSDDSFIEYTTLLPGQTSPWKVMERANPAMAGARVEFKTLSGERVPHYSRK